MLPVKDHQNGKDKMMFKEQKLHFCLMVNIAQIHAWKIEEDGQQKWLVRVHTFSRLALFTPTRTQTSPISEDKLTCKRITWITASDH